MKLIITFIFICKGLTSFSQTDTITSYVIIRIGIQYDNTNLKTYYLIKAELGCDEAKEIYGLKAYNNKKKAMNEGGLFYPDKKDSVYPYFNYFHSTTEILNYMAKNGWGLSAVYNDTFSDYNIERTGNGDLVPVATVVTRPVFCFKK
jgi:hypothetical protein